MNNCNDSWTSKDKALHFGVCFVLAAICPLVAIICAIGKEAYDMKQNGNHWCWKDVVADAVGIALGSGIHAILIYLICHA
jgi:uncharacterized protein YfiM (DUF2279 family)